jgi:hypothetical protein
MKKMMKSIICAAVGSICCIFDSSAMINNPNPTRHNASIAPVIYVNPGKIQERLNNIFNKLERELANINIRYINGFSIAPCRNSWISKNNSKEVLEKLIQYVNRQSSVYPKSKALFDRAIVGANAISPTVLVSSTSALPTSNTVIWEGLRVDGHIYGMYVTRNR